MILMIHSCLMCFVPMLNEKYLEMATAVLSINSYSRIIRRGLIIPA